MSDTNPRSTITIKDITYMKTEEHLDNDGDPTCWGCAAKNNSELCTILGNTCGNSIYVEVEDIAEPSEPKYTLQQFTDAYTHVTGGGVIANWVIIGMNKYFDPEYQQYLKLKEKYETK